ncbi:MAG: amidohydrolase, partial [Planctomycetota bacterium]
MRRALTEGRSYASRRAAYERAKAAGEDVAPFRRDVRLEALADILDGDIWVNCHCYRADEILRLLAVAEDFGFRIAALHHVLEGYRVMPEIARHGCGTATFADWWAYKIEAYEAVPQNAGMMLRYGINSTIKSDSGDLVRHMNMEAAKCMHASDLTPNEALRLITLNPARLFGLDDRLGSIEVGKDGDIAVFDGHPLDSFSRCVMTLVEGEVYFTHPEFDPDDPPAPRPIRSFDHAGAAWKDAKGKTPLTINARDDAAVETDNLSYAIINGTVHPVSGPPIAGGVVLIDDGKIRAVGRNLTIPAGATVVDATGLHVWPGLINAGTTVGMHEIGQVSVTVDTNEPGTYQPDVRAVSAVNPHSAMIEVTRAAGVTTAVVLPGGPTVAGQAGVIHLSGWTLPEMLEESEIGLVVSLPSASPEPVREVESSQRGGHAGGGDASDDEGPLVELEEFIRNARLYAEAAQSDEHFERIVYTS